MVRVLGEGRGGRLVQPVDAGALSVQCGQHGDCLDAESVFDQGGVAQLRQPQLLLDRGRECGQAALASGTAQGGDDLRLGQPRRLGRGGGNGQHRAGFGCGDSAGTVGEGAQETRENIAAAATAVRCRPGCAARWRPGGRGRAR